MNGGHEGDGWAPSHIFIHQSRDFVLGFEMGQLWMDLQRAKADGDSEVGATIHSSNAGEALRIAGHFGFRRSAWKEAADWVDATFASAGAAPPGGTG